jgi:hypothetical protein
MYQKNKLLFIIFLLLSAGSLKAQIISNSPYSSYGIGEINPSGYSRNVGMGYTGVSAPNNDFINITNPALLYHNRLTIFETGITGQYKRISNTSTSQRTGTVSLSHLGIAFPVSRRSTISVGLRPYSAVNFNAVDSIQVTKDPGSTDQSNEFIRRSTQGTGGTNQALLAAGYHIGKGFSVGLQAAYLFGTISNTYSLTHDTLYTTVLNSDTRISSFVFKPGISYRLKVKNDVFFNTGATYELASNLNATRTRDSYRPYGGSSTNGVPNNDTIAQRGDISFPGAIRLGVSFDRPYHWTFAADVAFEQWTEFKRFGQAENSRNIINAGVGAEWIPNINSLGSYFNVVTYRAGLYYNQMPFIIHDNRLNDFGINFGASFPVNKNLSNINIALAVGQRGTTSNNLIKEQYIRFNLGFTLSDRWFIKNRVD